MIKVFNRKNKQLEIEKVAGEKILNWLYISPIGKNLLELIVKKKLTSKIYGSYCDLSLSAKKIPSFVTDLDIDMSIYKKNLDEFTSFNDFFTRELKSQYLNFNSENKYLTSPCQSRVLAYTNINNSSILNIKGFNYSLNDLLQDEETSSNYECGTCMIFRLCPTDYHRFHFIDSGICEPTHNITGSYYSVNPISLEKMKKVFVENKRQWSILKSDNFDDIIYIEVGATCVGSIIQSYSPNTYVKRGDEKGYFKFGGSTVILLFKKDSVIIDDDILENSKNNIETLINVGEIIGHRKDI